MTTLRAAAQQALEALEAMMTEFKALDLPYGSKAYGKAKDARLDLRAALAEPVQGPVALMEPAADNDSAYAYADGWNDCVNAHKQAAPPQRPVEPVQCDPQYAVTEDGYCEWVCPVPNGYLMQCCDCGLIHEVDFRVVRYEPQPSEDFVVIDGPNMQAQLRMRRRDDLSPKKSQEPVAWGVFGANLHDMFFTEEEAHEMARLKGDGSTVAPLYASPPQRPAEPQEPVATVTSETGADINMSWWHEPALPVGTKLYAAPPQRKPLTEGEISSLWDSHIVPVLGKNGINPIVFARAIEAAHGIKSKT